MAEQNDHWQELADLLGVPDQGAAPASKPARAPEPEPAVEERRMAPEHEPRLEPISEEPAAEWEAEFDEEDTAVDESLLRDEPIGEAPEEIEGDMAIEPVEAGARPETEEEKPRRGRRRRRRGRRGGRDGENREEREPRRPNEPQQRDQGRRRDENQRREEEPREPEEIEQPRPAPPLEADDTDFSNWNVPSWQELIASLYRPDR